jgi:hypothetical protein
MLRVVISGWEHSFASGKWKKYVNSMPPERTKGRTTTKPTDRAGQPARGRTNLLQGAKHMQ